MHGNHPPVPHQPRDLSLDMLRGYAILAITANHLRSNAIELDSTIAFSLTLTQLTLSSAAEIFVFISGMLLYIARARLVGAARFIPGRALVGRIVRRMLDLVAAIVAVQIIGAMVVAALYPPVLEPDWLAPLSYQGVLDDAVHAVLGVLLFQSFPNAIDVLQLYLVLLAFGAFQLTWLVRHERFAWAVSGGLYAIVQLTPFGAGFDLTGWYYDPLAWQFLFFLGMAAARHDALRRLQRPPIVFAAAAFLLAGSAVKFVVEFDLLAIPALQAIDAQDLPWRGKPAIEPLRLLTALAQIIVLRWLITAVPGWLRHVVGVLLLPVGQRSLVAYTISCVFVLAGAAAVLGPVTTRAGYAALLVSVLAATWAFMAVLPRRTARRAATAR